MDSALELLEVPPSPQEVTVPDGARWWNQKVREWTDGLEGVREETRRIYEKRLRLTAELIERLGFERPTNAAMVSARMVEAVALTPTLAPGTRHSYLLPLRPFLAAEGNPIARSRRLWQMVRSDRIHVDWLTSTELARLFSAANGRERLVVALAGFNALRNGEVRSLTYGHLRMVADQPRLVFPGKGNRARDIAMASQVWDLLLEPYASHGPSDKIYPWSATTLRTDLYSVCRRAGVRQVGPHTLRRTWGRIAYYEADVPLLAIRDVYGHASVEMTERYIGVELGQMRVGMDSFSRLMAQRAGAR